MCFFSHWPLVSLWVTIVQQNAFSWFDLEINSSGFLELFAVNHSGGNSACWELVWLEDWNKIILLSGGKVFFIWLYWLIFNLKCVPLSAHSSLQCVPRAIAVSLKKFQGIYFGVVFSLKCFLQPIFSTGLWQCYRECITLICDQCFCLLCFCHTTLTESDERKRKWLMWFLHRECWSSKKLSL